MKARNKCFFRELLRWGKKKAIRYILLTKPTHHFSVAPFSLLLGTILAFGFRTNKKTCSFGAPKAQCWPLLPRTFLRESTSFRAPKVLDAFQNIRIAEQPEIRHLRAGACVCRNFNCSGNQSLKKYALGWHLAHLPPSTSCVVQFSSQNHRSLLRTGNKDDHDKTEFLNFFVGFILYCSTRKAKIRATIHQKSKLKYLPLKFTILLENWI